jgi:Ca2+-binding EF-hand superfamily protein
MGNKNALRKPNDQEIIMLMASTGLSRSEVLEWHERFLVDHPSGYLNKYEFIDTYKRTYASSSESVAEACALFTFAAVDLDHNGKVSFSEFIVFSGVANKSSSSSYEQRLGMAFDIFDVSITRVKQLNNIGQSFTITKHFG